MCTNTHTLTCSFSFSLPVYLQTYIYCIQCVLHKLYNTYSSRYLYIALNVCQRHEKHDFGRTWQSWQFHWVRLGCGPCDQIGYFSVSVLFILSVLWWRRVRGLWKLPDGRAYLRLLIFLPASLTRACASPSLAFHMTYCAFQLNKQCENIQTWCTPFPIWKQSVVPCPALTVASWPAYRFLRRQVRWSCIPISLRIFHSFLWST